MSLRARLIAPFLRRAVRPLLARTEDPEKGARDFERVARLFLRPAPFACDRVRWAAGLRLHWISSGPVAPGKVILYLHGGAYFSGSGRTHGPMLSRLSRLSGVEVCALDYRLLQEAAFPAAFDDSLAAWDHLMGLGYRPSDVILGGDSAGGGLALSLLSAVLRRGARPAAVFGFSPWTDLTLSGDSLRRNSRRDLILPVERIHEVAERYLAGGDPRDPRASPLWAEFPDPPPALFQVGAEEALLDDTARIAARLRGAGGEVVEEVWPGLPHVWQLGDGWIPEARTALQATARFVQTSFERAKR